MMYFAKASLPATLHQSFGLVQARVGQKRRPPVGDVEEVLEAPHEGALVPSRGVDVERGAQCHGGGFPGRRGGLTFVLRKGLDERPEEGSAITFLPIGDAEMKCALWHQ